MSDIRERYEIGEPVETKDELLGIQWTINVTAPDRESHRYIAALFGRTKAEVLSMAEKLTK
jgi:hypothetical protein